MLLHKKYKMVVVHIRLYRTTEVENNGTNSHIYSKIIVTTCELFEVLSPVY